MDRKKTILDRRAVLGAILVILGLVLTGENAGFLGNKVHDIVFSWQMVVIAIGFISLSRRGNNMFSFALIIIGGIFLIPNLFNYSIDTGKLFLPLCLVCLGVLILFRKRKTNECFCKPEDTSSDMLDEVNVFGGSERKITTNGFRGGKVTSIFGGANYDMIDCELAAGKNVLDVVNIFGGIKMVVPSDWRIHIEVVSIFGGFADKRRSVSGSNSYSDKELHITGIVIFGGGEIKNF